MKARKKRHGSRQGMTLVEIMIVVVIMAMIAAAVGFSAMGASKQARIDATKSEVKSLANIAEAYLMSHADDDCPSIDDLLSSGLMKQGSNTKDPWAGAYAISCESGGVNVHSAGPDRASGNEDDITAF